MNAFPTGGETGFMQKTTVLASASEKTGGGVDDLRQSADKFFVGRAGDIPPGAKGKILAPDGVILLRPGGLNGLTDGVFHRAAVFTAAAFCHRALLPPICRTDHH